MSGIDDDSWKEYQKLVLHELERLNDNFEGMRRRQEEQSLTIENIKVKSSFLGLVAGFLASISYNIGKYIVGK